MLGQLLVAIVAGLVGGLGGNLLSIFIAPKFQHRLWGTQKKDELRFQTIQDFNRITNAYVSSCMFPDDRKTPLGDWLRDLNIAGATIRALFVDETSQAARRAVNMVKTYDQWDAADLATKLRWRHEFTDACHVALTALYAEVLPDMMATRRGA